MNTYFKIDPLDNSIMKVIRKSYVLEKYLTKENNNGKPWIVPVTIIKPDYNPNTHNRTGPVNAYDFDTDTATQTYNIRERSAADIATNEIKKLELEVTPRRVRDAVLTDDGKTWLEAKEAEIAVERAKL